MAASLNLMESGVPALVANLIGTDCGAVTCAGTSSTTAAALPWDVNNLTSAGGATSAILPALGTYMIPSDGMAVICSNTSATTATIYPPANATFNTAASSSMAIAQYNTVIFIYATATKIFTVVSA